MFGESKRSATEGCESGTEDHSVIGIFGRRDDFFFHTTRGFVHHEKHKAVAQSGSGALAAGLFETTRRGVASTPFLERFIRSLRFAFVFVKTAAGFSTEHSTIAQPMQDGGSVIATAVGFFQRPGDVNRDVHADLVDQTQRPHRHSPGDKRIVDLLCIHSRLEKFRGIEQIRKQNTIDEKAGTVAHLYRQLSDLARKCERSSERFLRSFFADDDFDQFHPLRRIEKMQTDHAVGGTRYASQFANRQGRGICGEDRFRTGFVRELAKDFLFDVDLFRSSFNDHLHIAQLDGNRRGNDAGATFFRFLFTHQTAFNRVRVSLLDNGQAAVELFATDIAQNHRNPMRAEPLRDPGTHYAGANHRGVYDFCRRSF